jgi:putative restriction endonuclease
MWKDDREHRDGGTNPSDLVKYAVQASFADDILSFFQSHPSAITDVATELVHTHFQPSFLEDLFAEVELSLDNATSPQTGKRDPAFRQRVLRAYGDKCAVCGFHMVLNQRSIGVEAAHIKWHNAGGPDIESKGLALCTLHHKLFDYGVFRIEPSNWQIRVSRSASFFNSAETYMRDFNNQKMLLPHCGEFLPDAAFLSWHRREIFKELPQS